MSVSDYEWMDTLDPYGDDGEDYDHEFDEDFEPDCDQDEGF